MTPSRLTPFQTELLRAFFRHERRFFLTGGAALAGYHLRHRSTNDLDLFVTTDVLDEGDAALAAAADELGASVEKVQTFPTFRRRLVRRQADSVVVDLVYDSSPQGGEDKPWIGDVRVDSAEEILANKLCTLLSRAEPRDLVDVCRLEQAGLSMEAALPLAQAKDGGLTPAGLAWVLGQIRIGDDAAVPGGLSAAELRTYVDDLQARLTRLAFPAGSGA